VNQQRDGHHMRKENTEICNAPRAQERVPRGSAQNIAGKADFSWLREILKLIFYQETMYP